MTRAHSLVGIAIITALLAASVLAGNTARTASAVVRGGEGEVNVALGLNTDGERRDVHELTANTDVALADEDAGLVNRLGVLVLEDLGLKTALEQLGGGELQDKVKALLLLTEEAVANHTAEEGITLEKTTGVLGVKGQQLTGGLFGSNDQVHKTQPPRSE